MDNLDIDREAQVLLSDVRMDGVGFSLASLKAPFCFSGVTGPVSLCYAVRGAPLWLEVETTHRRRYRLEPGSMIGLSGVVPHWFKSEPDLPVRDSSPLKYAPLGPERDMEGPARLLVGHAPMETLAFTSTLQGPVIVPPDGGRVARRIQRAIDGIEDELGDPDPVGGVSAVVRRLSEVILMNFSRLVIASTPDTATPLGLMGDPRIMRAVAAAVRAPLETWTVERLAGVAAMSRTAFARRFHQLTGDTPLHMLARIRLRLSAEVLRQGGGTLEEAAAAAGYGSAASFIRAFRRIHHTTPGQWRAVTARRRG